MSGNLFVNCPICDYENQVSAVSDKKIITCRNCEAPVYNTFRPANGADVGVYQALLKQWGEKYRKNEPDRLQKQIESSAAQNQHQAETAALKEQVNGLQAEVKEWEEKCIYTEERYQKAMSQLKSQHADEIEKQQSDLQAGMTIWKTKHQEAQEQYATLQNDLTKVFEDFRSNSQKKTRYIDDVIEDIKSRWEKAKASEARDNQAIESSMRSLLPKDYHASEIPKEELEKVRESVEVRENQNSTERKNDNAATHPTVNNTSKQQHATNAVGAMPKTIGNIKMSSQFFDRMISRYNRLAMNTAREFREDYDAQRLTIPQDGLESQRVTLDGAMPIFEEGLGSYWRIQDDTTSTDFLVLDKERFSFNSSNYESITVCYDFNNLNQDELKDFDSGTYNLDAYTIIQPAKVIFQEAHGQWQLQTRGRLSFEKRLSSKPFEEQLTT